jgi:hypothetical protein
MTEEEDASWTNGIMERAKWATKLPQAKEDKEQTICWENYILF